MVDAGQPLDQAYLEGGTWQVDIAGTLHPAVVSLRPLYDPEMKRVKS
jgi:4-methylaminobutanoate oxidase (formaldehyde-forming)